MTYRLLLDAVKKVAFHFGLDPNLFGTHSLQIGGASALAASGVPDYIIQLQGGWQSLCFLQYIRMASSLFTKALRALSSKSKFSSLDVKRMSIGLACVASRV